MLWNRPNSWSLLQQTAEKKLDRTVTFHAALCMYPRQHRKTPYALRSLSKFQGPDHAGRASTQLPAGSFMGLMGQILKDMSQALPCGSSLTVDKLSYHPAGNFVWCM